jgi:hypothetical protein
MLATIVVVACTDVIMTITYDKTFRDNFCTTSAVQHCLSLSNHACHLQRRNFGLLYRFCSTVRRSRMVAGPLSQLHTLHRDCIAQHSGRTTRSLLGVCANCLRSTHAIEEKSSTTRSCRDLSRLGTTIYKTARLLITCCRTVLACLIFLSPSEPVRQLAKPIHHERATHTSLNASVNPPILTPTSNSAT